MSPQAQTIAARETAPALAGAPTARGARRRTPGVDTVLAVGPLLVGLALWAVSLTQIDLSHLGASGLIGVAPASWYAALAVLVGGAAAQAWRERPRIGVVALYVLGVIAVLYATIPVLTDIPQYAWTYKHIGVVRFLEARGAVDSSVDIYNRWPGMFAFAAALSKVTGVDPVNFAGWIEPLFTAIDALLVAAITRVLTRDLRVAGMSALAFICTDWVGQTYFSPQTLAYTLDLVLVLLVVANLHEPGASRVHVWLTEQVARVTGRPQAIPAADPGPRLSRRTTVALVVLVDVAIIATHQLTPYVVLLQLAVLWLLGSMRPLWLLGVLGALTLAYLVPNLAYLNSHYGLLSGFDPLANASVTKTLAEHRAYPFAPSGQWLSFAAIGLAMAGAAASVWSGRAYRVIPIVALMIVPFGILFGQSYGGEASLRVFLFSSPWRDVAIAWGIASLTPRVRVAAAALVAAGFAALFLISALGNAGTNVFPRTEVAASEYFYSHAPAGSVLALAGEDFPLRIGARYDLMAGPPGSDHSPDLLEDLPSFSRHTLGAGDIPATVRDLYSYSRSAYLVFSTSQYKYASIFGTTPSGSLESLQRAVASSPRFRLWYSNADTRIYRAVG